MKRFLVQKMLADAVVAVKTSLAFSLRAALSSGLLVARGPYYRQNPPAKLATPYDYIETADLQDP